jgi:methionine aminopeptidase
MKPGHCFTIEPMISEGKRLFLRKKIRQKWMMKRYVNDRYVER